MRTIDSFPDKGWFQDHGITIYRNSPWLIAERGGRVIARAGLTFGDIWDTLTELKRQAQTHFELEAATMPIEGEAD